MPLLWFNFRLVQDKFQQYLTLSESLLNQAVEQGLSETLPVVRKILAYVRIADCFQLDLASTMGSVYGGFRRVIFWSVKIAVFRSSSS